MTWIQTVSMEDDERVKKAMLAQRAVYPIEYATPVHPENDGLSSSIVASHSLIPDALFHAFSTFGALMSPELPLQAPPARNDRDHGLCHQSLRLLN